MKGEETTRAAIGDPMATDSYTLCVVDGLRDRWFDAIIPPGGICGSAPCWKDLGARGFKFADKAGRYGGIQKIVLRPGPDGSAKVIVRGRGDGLVMPFLPLSPPVRVQLQSTNGTCWAADFRLDGVIRSGFDQFSAKASVPLGSPGGAFVD